MADVDQGSVGKIERCQIHLAFRRPIPDQMQIAAVGKGWVMTGYQPEYLVLVLGLQDEEQAYGGPLERSFVY